VEVDICCGADPGVFDAVCPGAAERAHAGFEVLEGTEGGGGHVSYEGDELGV